MIVFLAKYRISRRQMVVMESPATLRKITLCGELRDRFEPGDLSARKLQTLGKCSSTNLE